MSWYSLLTLLLVSSILYIQHVTCLYVEDTLKISLMNIKSGDYIKLCCDIFCSFYKYDIFKKTFFFLKKENNITLYNCYGVIKIYYSKKYLFYFSTYINVEQNNIIEIIDSFDKVKISRYVFFTPLFEYITTKKNNMVYYIPFGYYKFGKLKNKMLNHKKTHNNNNNNNNTSLIINNQKIYYTYEQHTKQINKFKQDIFKHNKYKQDRKNNKYKTVRKYKKCTTFRKNCFTYIIPLFFYYIKSMNLKKCIPQHIKYNIHTSNNNNNNNNNSNNNFSSSSSYYYYCCCYFFYYTKKKHYILSLGHNKLLLQKIIFNKCKIFQHIIEQNEKNKLRLYMYDNIIFHNNMMKKKKQYNNFVEAEIYKFLEILLFSNSYKKPHILYSKDIEIIESHTVKKNNRKDIKNYNENKRIKIIVNSSNYKYEKTQSILFLLICLLFMFFFLLFIYVIIRKKQNKKNVQNKEINKNTYNEKNLKRLAEIHVEYKKKIQTNLGSKIKDITNRDLIKLITYNKADSIVVCQP
ncbi:conserved Plasmodium membrane protein, unknown function [Plasmodium sp. gorilla clade G1]|nr:conserved Plasmodium membrane protein, unknown function [Plasmodium sp. gorilla clade G1]